MRERFPYALDAYRLFLGVAIGVMAVVSIAMLAIGIWLYRRNRRLPRLVKGRRNRKW